MKRVIYTLFFFSMIGVLMMSNQKGRADAGGKGSTGAPGDDATVCRSCHNGPIDAEVKIYVIEGADTIQSYEPGKSYNIHIRINKTGGNDPKAYGFQMTLLNAAEKVNGPNLKELTPISSNVKLTTLKNRLYAEHTDRSEKNLFEIQWVAPAKGSGPVTVYAGGTAVNANGSDSGDGGNKVALQLNEKSTTSVGSHSFFDIRVYPNPFTENIQIQNVPENGHHYELLDLGGRVIRTGKLNPGNISIDASSLKEGIYFMRFKDQQQFLLNTQKLIKRNQRT